MADWTIQEVYEAMAKVRERALADDEYCRAALADPRTAIAEIAGKAFPAELSIRAVAVPRNAGTFVLPDLQKEDELGDQELMAVAGAGQAYQFRYDSGIAGGVMGFIGGMAAGAAIGVGIGSFFGVGGAGLIVGGAIGGVVGTVAVGGAAGGIAGLFS